MPLFLFSLNHLITSSVNPDKKDFSVTKKIPGANNVTISGTFLSRVFEGPYKNMGSWISEMKKYVESKKKKIVIISGIGVREYYKKLGYRKQGPYMVKNLKL